MEDDNEFYENTQPTATTRTTNKYSQITWDSSHFKTKHGILKALIIILNLICLIILCCADMHYDHTVLFKILTIYTLIVMGILLIVYSIHFVDKYPTFPWLKAEFAASALMTIQYSVMMTITLSYAPRSVALGFAALFGWLTTVAYGYNTWVMFITLMREGFIPVQSNTLKHPLQINSPV